MLAKEFNVDFDVSGQIGKRYRRQDAIGTPYCITVDFDSENDESVTLRDRDTMEQIRLPIADLVDYIAQESSILILGGSYMARLSQEKINEIRQSVDIVDVIGQYLLWRKKEEIM